MNEEIGIEMTSEGAVTIVAFKASSISDTEGITKVSLEIRKLIAEKYPKKIVFDFESVKFFSSQVLGMLLDVRAKLKTYDGEVVISGINPQLYRVFKITNLDKIFRFFPDAKNAVEKLNEN